MAVVRETSSTHSTQDYFTLAMQWPHGFCEDGKHQCTVPKNVPGWTLHGLWPSSRNGRGAEYCDLKFDYDKVKHLEEDLFKYWPNLLTTNSMDYTRFWKHEYEKHGSCASSYEGLQTMEQYFSTSIQLLHLINPAKILLDAGIVPRSEAYSAQDIYKAISNNYGGRDVCMKCNRGVLSELQVCLKEIQYLRKGVIENAVVMNCPKCSRHHACAGKVYYRPPSTLSSSRGFSSRENSLVVTLVVGLICHLFYIVWTIVTIIAEPIAYPIIPMATLFFYLAFKK